MRYLLLAILVVAIPCCAARKGKIASAVPTAPGQLNPESAESQMMAARAHLEMGCPTDATYHVAREGSEYRVQVKYVTGYGPNKEAIHATDRGALVVLDQDGKLVRIDRGSTPSETAVADQAVAADEAVASDGQPAAAPAS